LCKKGLLFLGDLDLNFSYPHCCVLKLQFFRGTYLDLIFISHSYDCEIKLKFFYRKHFRKRGGGRGVPAVPVPPPVVIKDWDRDSGIYMDG
jgi:hypothetical protein